MEALGSHQIDATTKKLFKPQLHASELDQIRSLVEFDEQVDITPSRRLVSGNRIKQ